jgi:hypothetical protein
LTGADRPTSFFPIYRGTAEVPSRSGWQRTGIETLKPA